VYSYSLEGLINVSPAIKITTLSVLGLGSTSGVINTPTNPLSTSSSVLLEKYSVAYISKIPGVEIESVASTLQQILSSGSSAPYK